MYEVWARTHQTKQPRPTNTWLTGALHERPCLRREEILKALIPCPLLSQVRSWSTSDNGTGLEGEFSQITRTRIAASLYTSIDRAHDDPKPNSTGRHARTTVRSRYPLTALCVRPSPSLALKKPENKTARNTARPPSPDKTEALSPSLEHGVMPRLVQ